MCVCVYVCVSHRSEFQRLWRHELVARQEDALEEALTQSVTEAWSDLRWRRDVALALDVSDTHTQTHTHRVSLSVK